MQTKSMMEAKVRNNSSEAPKMNKLRKEMSIPIEESEKHPAICHRKNN